MASLHAALETWTALRTKSLQQDPSGKVNVSWRKHFGTMYTFWSCQNFLRREISFFETEWTYNIPRIVFFHEEFVMRTKYTTDQLLILLEVSPLVLKHSENVSLKIYRIANFNFVLAVSLYPCTPSQVAHLVRVYLNIHSMTWVGILLPPRWGPITRSTPPPPQYFIRLPLTVCYHPSILLIQKRCCESAAFCPRTQHKDTARSQTQTLWL